MNGYILLNSVVHPRQVIGKGVLLGAGSVVTRTSDLKAPFLKWVGSPAHMIGHNKQGEDKCNEQPYTDI